MILLRFLTIFLAAAIFSPASAVDGRSGAFHPAFTERVTEREAMVRDQLGEVNSPRVLAAMQWVPRHAFVPENVKRLAYADRPLPIGYDQTISQPLVVAYMTERLEVHAGHRVLELGTGSGYQAAVLGELAKEVYSVEIVPELAERAASVLQELGYENVYVRAGDGYDGWPERAPFDRIIITFAVPTVPPPLLDQLAPNGRLVMPEGDDALQWVTVLDKDAQGEIARHKTMPVRFVPMLGEHAAELATGDASAKSGTRIALPAPSLDGTVSLERLLAERRSIREFSQESLTKTELAQLLWAAQGITSSEGFRTAPSAGATFPTEIYAVIKRVSGLEPGVYHYFPSFTLGAHTLEPVFLGDPMPKLALAAPQSAVEQSAVAIVVTAVVERTARRYGTRAQRYVTLEAGHVAQNVLLQAEALGLGAVPIGAFHDETLQELVQTKADALYLLCIGRKVK
ncbi:protein-L-isoaspartate(D-aspartate) O-methyltransferase [bacterium]|nr:protein-L-isoaspartate(D-aspartate) O-methyltransferase [bacterium]MBU1985424.1 protein-L-isoaspartate(D-aspartate) O-methyltransferase [bacterium]